MKEEFNKGIENHRKKNQIEMLKIKIPKSNKKIELEATPAD
jgi:hypothetical protein